MEILHELLIYLCINLFLLLLALFVIGKHLVMVGSRDLPPKKGVGSFVFEGKSFSSEEPLVDDDKTTKVETSGSPLKKHGFYERGLLELVELKAEEGLTIAETDDSVYHVIDESSVLCEDQVVREIEIESGMEEINVDNLMDLEGWERNEDDDWEGVERSELEKDFGDALVFVEESKSLGNDVKLKLYGLSKIVLEGPCIAPQPMALKITARAKWNAWQQLMDMNRETAMELYISLLSKSIPDWKQRDVNVSS
ncbi:acyl-CoA-binding domain-containing protein 3-like [Impatiens glandulifera]|uniref:acyl-CoA-binding domain-containing protein 3-like n=1 Tax=Impatiens glandulifera TaxID=253017 RepID=UPI001FB0B0DA|nr:acyl-CoA-binding domain-containing protein 3-like [Impatiens glandulifera]